MTEQTEAVGSEQAFWSFALSLYGQPGIPALCLRLQAEGGTDVMLLIAHCYAFARQSAPLSEPEMRALQSYLADWRGRAVLPLRALRVDLRASVSNLPEAEREAFRARLKQMELAAEKVQAGMISRWLDQRRIGGGGDLSGTLRAIIGEATLSLAEEEQLVGAAHAAAIPAA